MKLNIKRLSENAKLPSRAYEHDAGLDLYCLESFEVAPGTTLSVPTGVTMEIPPGFVGLVRDRSSMARKGLLVLAGVVDAGYRGEILVVLHNLGSEGQKFEQGSKIAQMLLLPVSTMPITEVAELDGSERGARGFGSSGK